MPSINNKQKTKIAILINKAGLMDDKKNIMLQYSGGRTDSTKELTSYEALRLIQALQQGTNDEGKKKRMRNKILSMAHDLGWKADGKVNMKSVNEWCVQRGYLKKKLDDYTYSELPKLVSQFEAMYKSKLSTK